MSAALERAIDAAEEEALKEREVMEEANAYLFSDAGMAQLLYEMVISDGHLELAKPLAAFYRNSINRDADPTSQMIARKNVLDCLAKWADKIARL